jgi:hypothetical protein
MDINLDQRRVMDTKISTAAQEISGVDLDDIKVVKECIHQLFHESVTDILLKSDWSSDEIANGYPSFKCQLSKSTVLLQLINPKTNTPMNYKYMIQTGDLFIMDKKADIQKTGGFFKRLSKILNWVAKDQVKSEFR